MNIPRRKPLTANIGIVGVGLFPAPVLALLASSAGKLSKLFAA